MIKRKQARVAQLVETSRQRSGGSHFLKEMYFTYILQSEKNGQFYIGHCSDLELRLTEHNSGRVKSTKYKRPWKVVYFERYTSKLEANRRELEIKKKKSRKYICFLLENKRE